MSQPIVPTIGRIVWYRAYESDDFAGAAESRTGGQACAAIVTHVWSDTCVNLAVFDANGGTHSRTSVLLVQPGSDVPGSGYCEWMPYQIGQAAKAAT